MSSFVTITPDKLLRLIGLPHTPVIIDVRTAEDFASAPTLIPGSFRHPHESVQAWASAYKGRSAVVVCHRGAKLSQGVAAWLRHEGISADVLEGGFEAWKERSLPLIPVACLPPRDAQGRTVWVTRTRPKVDRIACPWLIRRFVDPAAVFLFVAPQEVASVGERFDAAPFDIEGVFWSHRSELCTFDVMVSEFGLQGTALDRLARIVRGADTAQPDLEPEVAGFLAASLGLSRMYADDLAQLDAGMMIYDAFYRWCRDATEETHSWPTRKGSV